MKKDVISATAAILVSVSAWSCCGCCAVTGILNAFGIRPPVTEKPLPDPAIVLATPERCEREFGDAPWKPTAKIPEGEMLSLVYREMGVEIVYLKETGGSWTYASAFEAGTPNRITPKEVVRRLHRSR